MGQANQSNNFIIYIFLYIMTYNFSLMN